jgi:ribosome-associated protein
VREVQIRGDEITLGQLLKLVGLIDSGAGAKEFLRNQAVWVNGEPEARRGKKLTLEDVVRVGGLEMRLAPIAFDPPR